MATIADVTISVGTNGEAFLTSNAGWTAVEVAPLGNLHLKVTNQGGINTVYNDTTGHSYQYQRNETPADNNQSVTLKIHRRSADVGTYWWAMARINGSSWVSAVFSGDANKPVVLNKYVSGTGSAIGTSNDSGRLPSNGDEADMTLEVTGTAPTISARVLWNGVEVIAPVTITDAALNAVGKVGFGQRTFNQDLQTTLYHVRRFTALDGVSAGGGGSNLLAKLMNYMH